MELECNIEQFVYIPSWNIHSFVIDINTIILNAIKFLALYDYTKVDVNVIHDSD